MKKTGVLGESENDNKALIALLSARYKAFGFSPLLRLPDGQIDRLKKIQRMLASESVGQYSVLIFSRDLDSHEGDKTKIEIREQWFNTIQSSATNQSLFLLHIYELEALVLADIEAFNKMYGLEAKFSRDPMKESDPKLFLQRISRNSAKGEYAESHCPEIFAKLDFDKICKVRYFNAFIERFEKLTG